MFDVTANQVRVGLSRCAARRFPGLTAARTRVVAVDLTCPRSRPRTCRRGCRQRHQRPKSHFAQRHGQDRRRPNMTSVNCHRELIDDLNDLPIKRSTARRFICRTWRRCTTATRRNRMPCARTASAARADHHEDGHRLDAGRGRAAQGRHARVMKTVSPDLQVKEFADQSLFVRAAIGGVLREGSSRRH